MALNRSFYLLSCTLLLLFLARPAHAFGAGNIASIARIEGQNWRHGDIEDTFLSLVMARVAGGNKFSKLDVKRIYFGNWLRDYSQAIDVGTVKYVSAEAIRLILWVLGFLSFGYGTKEFEVTSERLGCYRPEEHIDNPKDYADNQDARRYDSRLRGPVDERKELAVDERTGLKNYIANEDIGITTSAGLIRRLFRTSIELGRRYAQNGDKADLYEAFRLMGTGCHCLEDYAAHSNFTELCLIELGERDVFPLVGTDTQIDLDGRRVYPCVTGTFGGVDFLHSVLGEITDKVTQSEIQELEGTIQQTQGKQQDVSMLRSILDQVPEGLFGGKDEASKADKLQQDAQAARIQNLTISPREPEEATAQIREISKQIYPILEWHDEIMQSINNTIEQIPVLPDLLEQLQDQINIFVFSLLAPFVLPIINQAKTELKTGSSEIIQSARAEQLNVFSDNSSSNPTHSMLSKDHFSNILNEPAGKVAAATLKWVVPQLMAAWDDESVDIRRLNDRIIHGVFNHPAQRNEGRDGASECRQIMFGVVEQWWDNKSESEKNGLREKLSREGIREGRNHREGVSDSGHGCGKPLGLPNKDTAASSGATGGVSVLEILSGASGKQSKQSKKMGKAASEAVGGGALGAVVGGIVGGVGASLLSGSYNSNTKTSGSYDYDEEDRKKKDKKNKKDKKHKEKYAYGSEEVEVESEVSQEDTGDERKKNKQKKDKHKHKKSSEYEYGSGSPSRESYGASGGDPDYGPGFGRPTRGDGFESRRQGFEDAGYGGGNDSYEQRSHGTGDYSQGEKDSDSFGGPPMRGDGFEARRRGFEAEFGGQADERLNRPHDQGDEYGGGPMRGDGFEARRQGFEREFGSAADARLAEHERGSHSGDDYDGGPMRGDGFEARRQGFEKEFGSAADARLAEHERGSYGDDSYGGGPMRGDGFEARRQGFEKEFGSAADARIAEHERGSYGDDSYGGGPMRGDGFEARRQGFEKEFGGAADARIAEYERGDKHSPGDFGRGGDDNFGGGPVRGDGFEARRQGFEKEFGAEADRSGFGGRSEDTGYRESGYGETHDYGRGNDYEGGDSGYGDPEGKRFGAF